MVIAPFRARLYGGSQTRQAAYATDGARDHLSQTAAEQSWRVERALSVSAEDGVSIDQIDQVWSSAITSIRLARGFVYLTAIIDWFSRFVLAWELIPDSGYQLLFRGA